MKIKVSEVGVVLDDLVSRVVAVLPFVLSLKPSSVSCYRCFCISFASVYRTMAGRHRGNVGGEEKHPRQARLRVAA